MYTTVVFIAVISILIIIHEFGHFIVAKRIGVKVETFCLGFGPKLFSFKYKGTKYSLSLIPFGGYVKLAGDNWDDFKGNKWEYLSRPPIQRAGIIFFGPLLNYALALFCFCLVFIVGYPVLTTKVGGLIDGFPAKQVGILAGDKITKVDGKEVRNWEELQNSIFSNKDAQLSITALRENKELEFIITPKRQKIKNIFGQEETVGLIGIKPKDEFIVVKHKVPEAIILGTKRLFFLTAFTYKALFKMITGVIPFRESVTGPLGIFFITKQAIELGFNYLINITAILSLSLAIFNLLPLPVLDGGHIFLLAVEKVRGKPLGKKADEWITRLGFALIVFIAFFVFLNDLSRFEVLDRIINWYKGIK